MPVKRYKLLWFVLPALGAGIAAGVLVSSPILGEVPQSLGLPVAPSQVAAEAQPIDGGNALVYAKAVRDGQSEIAVRLTAWMNDRIRRVALEQSDPSAVTSTRAELCRRIEDRRVEGNLLRPEGIEDPYVFPPGAEIEAVGRDAGRDDLSAPVAERVWLRVTYPRRETAPLAPVNDRFTTLKPVRQWTVGVNLDREDQVVLKASIIGNLEIDRESISFAWPPG